MGKKTKKGALFPQLLKKGGESQNVFQRSLLSVKLNFIIV